MIFTIDVCSLQCSLQLGVEVSNSFNDRMLHTVSKCSLMNELPMKLCSKNLVVFRNGMVAMGYIGAQKYNH